MLKQDWMFLTGDTLLREVQIKFSDMDKQTTMSLKIRTMMQGDKPADEHVQEFEKAATEAEYEGKPLITEFKRSLNVGLRRRLMELDPLPQTIGKWYEVAIKFDHQWRVAKAEEAFYGKANAAKKPSFQFTLPKQELAKEWKPWQPSQWQQGNRNQAQFNQQHQYTPPTPKDPNAMDVDRNRQQRPSIKCFKCNKMGHMAQDCKTQLDI